MNHYNLLMDMLVMCRNFIDSACTVEIPLGKSNQKIQFPKSVDKIRDGKVLGVSVRCDSNASFCTKLGKLLPSSNLLEYIYITLKDTKGRTKVDCLPLSTWARSAKVQGPGEYGSLVSLDGLDLNSSFIELCSKLPDGTEIEVPEDTAVEIVFYYCDNNTWQEIQACLANAPGPLR